MRRIALLMTAAAGLAFADTACLAQAQGLFNSGSTQSGGTLNQGLSQGGLTQQGLTGGTATGGGVTGGGLSSGGLTGGSSGQSMQTDVGPQLNELGDVSQQIGQNAFVGQGNTGQFIGSRQAGTQQGQNTMPRFTQAGGGGQGFQQQQPTTNARRIRPRYRVAFDYDTLTTDTIAERSRQQVQTFETTFDLPDSITVELADGGTVILRGQAESAEMSRLIANVMRLEPGVRDVKNELVVSDEAASE